MYCVLRNAIISLHLMVDKVEKSLCCYECLLINSQCGWIQATSISINTGEIFSRGVGSHAVLLTVQLTLNLIQIETRRSTAPRLGGLGVYIKVVFFFSPFL